MNKHAPKKRKSVRGVSNAIMRRSRLKNKANKTKKPLDISNLKKQRNYVVNLNKQATFEFLVLITLLTANSFG